MRTKSALLTLLFFLILPSFQIVEAATFSLDPVSGVVDVGETLTVDIEIDTQGAETIAAQATMKFKDEVLELADVENGGFFPAPAPGEVFYSQSPTADGKLLKIAAHIIPDTSPDGEPRKGSGTHSVVHFRAIKAGVSGLEFVCGAGDTDSSIEDLSGNNLLGNCPDGSYTVKSGDGDGEEGGPTPTWSSGGGAFESCDRCGRCVGQPVPPQWESCQACHDQGGKWTVIGCVRTEPGAFARALLRIIFSITGGIGFLALLYGGGAILTSKGSPEQLEKGKSILRGAIVGILLVFFSVFILQFLGVTVFDLPGFGR